MYKKRKKQQAQRTLKTIEEEDTNSKGEKKELRASGKKSKVVGSSTMKSVKLLISKFTLLERILE